MEREGKMEGGEARVAGPGQDNRWLVEQLNLRQAEAVMEPGPLLVLAGPGSGKTRILTHRAAWLVAERGVRPAQVLCVTFTNKAAEEMRNRLVTLLGDAGRDVRVHTFHGLCTRILRQYGEEAGLDPHFVVADEASQSQLITSIVRKRGLSLEQFPPYLVIDYISEFKRDLKDPGRASPSERLPVELIEIAADYEAARRAAGLLDFDDLIGETVRLLARDRGVRAALQMALPRVLVDEYQDVDHAQFELLRHLAPQGSDVIAVADDAQSIYGWRGADPGLIDAYRKYYRPHVIELDQSYRSTETILYAAQSMIRRGDGADRQRRFMKTNGGRGDPIYHYIFANDYQERAWLPTLLRRLVEERGYGYGDIAILYRTHQLADEVEGALLEEGLPVQRARRESFFAEPRVREVIRYLHLVRSLSSDNLLAAFNFPQTLADELTVLQLQQLADVHRVPLADLARRGESFPELSPLTRANLAAFMRLFDDLLVPKAEESAAAAVVALFDVLEERRSPFVAEEFRTLRDAGAFFRFADAAATLRDHLAAGGRAIVVAPDTVDGACAAAILSETAERYLGARVEVRLGQAAEDASHGSDAITVWLGEDAVPITVTAPGGSLQYSLSEVAWRMAQDLLVAHETLASAPVVVYDLETTGTDVRRDEIIEIGAQRLEGGRPSGPAFYSLVRPAQSIAREAARVHGLSNEDVQRAEPIEEVLPRFLRYAGSHTVVGHNIVRFDNRIVDRETGRLYRRGFPNPAVDTLEMARRLYGEEPGLPESYTLETLLQRYALGEKVEHRAAGDVEQISLLYGHLLAENTLQLALRALPEYLPVVATGMAAAEVPLRDENAALWNGARRMLARRQGTPGLERAQALVGEDGKLLEAFDRAIEAVRTAEPPLLQDPSWNELRDRFLDQVATFDRFSHDHSLSAFLDYQALVTGLDTAQLRAEGKITLMTLHNAKGTEYPVVIIVGVEEENLPLWTTMGDTQRLAEERRVFYVGMTRAQKQLYLTSVRQRGEGPLRSASRFTFELPRRYVRRIQFSPRGELQKSHA